MVERQGGVGHLYENAWAGVPTGSGSSTALAVIPSVPSSMMSGSTTNKGYAGGQ